jgi:hypothetical protein
MPYLGRSPSIGVRSRYIYTASGGQTLFSGTDSNGKTLAYADGAYVDVYLNGVLLIPVTDYAATTKTSVVLTSGAAASDLLEILAYEISSIADTVSKANGGTFDGAITVNGNFSADGGTIKLDGNYPVGTNNVALGNAALDSNVSGGSNTAIGADALTANTASNNTAVGGQAGYSNSTGDNLTSVGASAGYSNSTGRFNTNIGKSAGYSNQTGQNNTNVGNGAGQSNTTNNLTAIGSNAATASSTGTDIVAVGKEALTRHTTGSYLVAIGSDALAYNTTSSYSTAVGYQAGYSSVGAGNTFIGYYSGRANTASGGSVNTFIGYNSGSSITSGEKNTILGAYNGNQGGLDIRTSSNNIVLSDGDGNPRAYWSSVGSTFFPATAGITTGQAANLYISSTTGEIARSTSSLRYKNTVEDSTHGLIELLTLRPVTYKSNTDGDTVFGGLIAEEVHDAGLIEFVQYDDEGKPDALAYGNMVSLCVKAIQELNAKVETLETRITALENA